HHNPIVAYNKAGRCEKAIYYSAKKGSCNHHQHISKKPEKCSLCDNHSLSVHTLVKPHYFFFHSIVFTEYPVFQEDIHHVICREIPNKGPPAV
ncbi:MAG TPA: hypothetical protein PLP34_08790, partial [Chitinophagaceae bacterium]|nr:hypothetical protein [Chitinophagaceae bacterium]